MTEILYVIAILVGAFTFFNLGRLWESVIARKDRKNG
jgi:hypothetical protein